MFYSRFSCLGISALISTYLFVTPHYYKYSHLISMSFYPLASKCLGISLSSATMLFDASFYLCTFRSVICSTAAFSHPDLFSLCIIVSPQLSFGTRLFQRNVRWNFLISMQSVIILVNNNNTCLSLIAYGNKNSDSLTKGYTRLFFVNLSLTFRYDTRSRYLSYDDTTTELEIFILHVNYDSSPLICFIFLLSTSRQDRALGSLEQPWQYSYYPASTPADFLLFICYAIRLAAFLSIFSLLFLLIYES